MNALYVTVSIPLLLVLAGFNHAHGLTTFGKSQNQGTQQPQKPPAQAKSCTTQDNCKLIGNTTCVGGQCLCGNNDPPINGKCKNTEQGANHLCISDQQCTANANCLPAKERNKTGFGNDDKICVCQEGFQETPRGTCGGESNFLMLPGLAIFLICLSATLN